MTTSEKILSLCSDLGIEPPEQTEKVIGEDYDELDQIAILELYKSITASDLLKSAVFHDCEIRIEITTVAVSISVSEVGSLVDDWSAYGIKPLSETDELVREIAVKRLEELKAERDNA